MLAEDFALGSLQATLWLDGNAPTTQQVLRLAATDWAEIFDGEPVILPSDATLPAEIPRFTLKSASEEWRLQIRANRIDVLWRRTDVPETSKGEFAVRAVDLLRTYCALVPTAEIRRIAFVVHRFAKVEQPSTELARYFARRELLDGPLNRPTELQLHAHKVYQPSGMPELNSWVRWRTGTLKNSSTPVVTVEQDLNTPADRTDQFTFDDVERFLARAHGETDSILDHYLAFQSN